MKITYPFAAVPNHVCRQGHGAINLAVLTVLLSHGRTTASAATIAAEVGCDRKSVFAAIKYWTDQGPKSGIRIVSSSRASKSKTGMPTIYEVNVIRMEDPTPTENGRGGVPKTEHPSKKGCTENGTPPVPKTEHPGVPKTEHKEEPMKKNPEEETSSAPHGGAVRVQEAAVEPEKSGGQPVAQVIEVFQKSLNPGINYGHRTHRAAAEWLLGKYGLDKVLAMAQYAVEIAGQEFAPVITNPSELKDKLGKLVIFKKKHGTPARVRIS